jgi:hypothetical protein
MSDRHPAPSRGLFGLRNRKTGLVVRLETVSGGIYGPKAGLTYDLGCPFWQTDNVQDLIMTAFEDRPPYNAHPETPTWNGIDVSECDPVRFFEHIEYGPGGGDPVAVTQYMRTFEFEIIDLRETRFQTADIMNIHYGIMQKIFSAYDMDKIDTMALAVVPVPAGTVTTGLRGDIGITATRGPCRIVEEVFLPSEWELTTVQMAQREEGLEHRLLLLDKADLAVWFDYDTIDNAREPAGVEEEGAEFRP